MIADKINRARRPWSLRLAGTLLLVTSLGLLGFVGWTSWTMHSSTSLMLSGETHSAAARSASSARPWFGPARAPLSAEEEAYAAALWPIHSGVKQSAVQMTFAGLGYKLGELDRAALAAKLRPLATGFAQAAERLHKLQPPPSQEKAHRVYADALRLYQESIAEMAKVVADGRDEHLIAAQQQSQRAAKLLLVLSDLLWPGEYRPN